jgi:hypothetical protein
MRIFLALFLVACSPDPGYFWGNVMEHLSVTYCQAVIDCGEDYVDLELCASHSMIHLCEDGKCSIEVDESAREALYTCDDAVADLNGEGCYWLVQWGRLPGVCDAIMDFEPGGIE